MASLTMGIGWKRKGHHTESREVSLADDFEQDHARSRERMGGETSPDYKFGEDLQTPREANSFPCRPHTYLVNGTRFKI